MDHLDASEKTIFGGDATSGQNVLLDNVLAELSEKLQRGMPIDLQSYCQRFPQLETDLLAAGPAMQMMAGLAAVQRPIELEEVADQEPTRMMLRDLRLLRELGRGGMGIVYEAEQLSLHRRVAVKVLPLASTFDARMLQRFQHEAQAAALLQHPNIVRIFSVGEERGIHYFLMELVEGRALSDWIAELRKEAYSHDGINASVTNELAAKQLRNRHAARPWSSLMRSSTGSSCGRGDRYDSAARIAAQVAEALEYAHQQGVVHRDVKPSNLLLDGEGKVIVVDFGLAQFATDNQLTMSGDLVGTLRYMSPEQVQGSKTVDARTDIYSLGLVLFEVLALRPAFAQEDRQQLLQAILESSPPFLRQLNPHIPRDLETIVLKATARQRQHRYQTAREFADDLHRFLQHVPIRARRVNCFEHAVSWTRRNPWLASFATSTLLLLLTLAIAGPLLALHQKRIAESAEHRNYVLNMSAAYDAWHEGYRIRAMERLQPYAETEYAERFEFQHLWNRSRALGSVPSLAQLMDVSDFDISPDGRTIVTVSRDGRQRLWDTDTQKLLATSARTVNDSIDRVAFASHGHWIAGVGPGGIVGISSAEDLRDLGTTKLEQMEIVALDLSSSGDYLAVAGTEGNLAVFDVKANRPQLVYMLPRHNSNTIKDVDFSPDGRRLAFSDGLGNITVWDMVTRKIEATFSTSINFAFLPICFSPDGKRLAVCDRGVAFYSTDTWQCIGRVDLGTGQCSDAAYSSDGKYLAVGMLGLFRIVETESLDVIDLQTTPGQVHAIRFFPDSMMLATTCRHGGEERVHFWDLQRHRQHERERRDARGIARIKWGASQEGLCLALTTLRFADQQWVTEAFAIRVDGEHLRRLDAPAGATAVTCNPADLTEMVFGVWNGSRSELVFWNSEKSLPSRRIQAGTLEIVDLLCSQNGQVLGGLYWDRKDRVPATLLVAKRDTGAVQVLSDDVPITSYDVSPNGRIIAYTDGQWNARSAHILDLSTSNEQLRPTFDAQFSRITAIAFDPLTGHLAIGDHDGGAMIFDGRFQERLLQWNLCLEPARCIAFSPQGSLIAIGHDNGVMQLVDRQAEGAVATFPLKSSPYCAAFSPDGLSLAIGCLDGNLYVLNAQGRYLHVSGAELNELLTTSQPAVPNAHIDYIGDESRASR